jgi:hypothetical protein
MQQPDQVKLDTFLGRVVGDLGADAGGVRAQLGVGARP